MSQPCDPKEIALKSFFLGPQAENGPWVSTIVSELLEQWFSWRKSRFPADGQAISREDQETPEFIERQKLFDQTVRELSDRYEGEVPKFSPRYIGHMFSEISLPALMGHIITLLHNPNNVSGESAVVGVQIEEEAVQALQRMVGFSPREGHGHFTSGGTVANFEALVRARERMSRWLRRGSGRVFERAHLGWDRYDETRPNSGALETEGLNLLGLIRRIAAAEGAACTGPVVLVPHSKHYSWVKGVSLLGLDADSLWPVELDSRGRMSIEDLRAKLNQAEAENRPILLVVSILGSTELGCLDPVHEVQSLLDRWRTEKGISIWHHVDAAYGGFLCTLLGGQEDILDTDSVQALQALSRVDSVTLDPHKLAYVPYSSGAFLTRIKRDYTVSAFDAPYVDFNPSRDRGLFTLEGSRSAAGAAATWMTSRCIGFDGNGYGKILGRTVRIRQQLQRRLSEDEPRIRVLPHAQSNILCFHLADPGQALSSSNSLTQGLFDSLPAESGFHVSKTTLRWSAYGKLLEQFTASWDPLRDTDAVVLIRLCLMNPFFDSREMKTDFATELMRHLKNYGSC